MGIEMRVGMRVRDGDAGKRSCGLVFVSVGVWVGMDEGLC